MPPTRAVSSTSDVPATATFEERQAAAMALPLEELRSWLDSRGVRFDASADREELVMIGLSSKMSVPRPLHNTNKDEVQLRPRIDVTNDVTDVVSARNADEQKVDERSKRKRHGKKAGGSRSSRGRGDDEDSALDSEEDDLKEIPSPTDSGSEERKVHSSRTSPSRRGRSNQKDKEVRFGDLGRLGNALFPDQKYEEKYDRKHDRKRRDHASSEEDSSSESSSSSDSDRSSHRHRRRASRITLERFAPEILKNASLFGGMFKYAQHTVTWNKDRNKYECLSLAKAIDQLCLDFARLGANAGKQVGVEMLCRRFEGIHLADESNNYNYASCFEFNDCSKALVGSKGLKGLQNKVSVITKANLAGGGAPYYSKKKSYHNNTYNHDGDHSGRGSGGGRGRGGRGGGNRVGKGGWTDNRGNYNNQSGDDGASKSASSAPAGGGRGN